MVDVDRQHGKRGSDVAAGKNGLDALGQPSAIGETSKRIELCHLFQTGVLRLQVSLNTEDSCCYRQPDHQLFLIHGLGQEIIGSSSQPL
jgi:hypothetical protein